MVLLKEHGWGLNGFQNVIHGETLVMTLFLSLLSFMELKLITFTKQKNILCISRK